MALISPLRSSIRARCRSSSSRAEISRARTAAAWSRAVESTRDVAHRRRPASTDPAATPSRTSPAPTAIPLRKSSCEPIAPARGGAVNTPCAVGGLGIRSAGVTRARDRGRDVAEELLGHPPGDARQHPLADATDHPPDDGVRLVGDPGDAFLDLLEAHVDGGADRARGAGSLQVHHERLVPLEVAQRARTRVRAPDGRNAGSHRHRVAVVGSRLQALAPGDRAHQDLRGRAARPRRWLSGTRSCRHR